MMIVVIGAAIANGAVEWILGFDDFIEYAKIVQVNILVQKLIDKPYKVILGFQVSRLTQNRHWKGDEWHDKHHDLKWNEDLFV
jgi:hypothetical protein